MSSALSISMLANGKSGPPTRHFLFRRRVLLIVVSLVGLCLSLFLGWLFSIRERQLLEVKFHSAAADRMQALKAAFANRFAILKFASSFYDGSEEVERREFRTFMESILTKENADIEFLAWSPRVPESLRSDFEKWMREDGFAECRVREFGGDGKLRPAGDRQEYYPLAFVEARSERGRLFGFDLNADDAARRAIERVMASKSSTVAECNLPDANGVRTRTLCLFQYAQSAPPAPEEARISRRLNTGVVIGAIRLETLLKKAVESLPRTGVNMYIYEKTDEGKANLLLARPSRLENRQLPILAQPPEKPQGLDYRNEDWRIADRSWTFYCKPIDSYLPNHRTWEPASAVLVGLFSTTILVGYLFLLTGRTEQVERLVQQRTEALRVSEERFRRLIDGAGDAFFLHDATGRIFDVNRRACEWLGYGREELLRMNIVDLDVLHTPVPLAEYPWNLPDAVFPMTLDGVLLRKNGETIPVEARITSLENEGRRWLLGLARDITERKQAEAALQAEQRLLRNLLELLENDRKLAAYEIHDGLAQQLTGLLLQLQNLQAAREREKTDAWNYLPKAIDLAGQCIAEARRLIGGLRPPILDESGVVAAIEYLVDENRRKESANIVFHHQVRFRHLAGPLEAALFRIAQECLTNACRYSQSAIIEIELKQLDGIVELNVQDWGVGFEPEKINGEHFGLRGIRERARLLGGNAEIVSAPGAGTTVTVRLPLVERSGEEDE
ncbi:MAG: CHASE domain-containing protein [Pirellulales bacterium]|nr:CHASE domain-containing protein [Pirellulales bacterium]